MKEFAEQIWNMPADEFATTVLVAMGVVAGVYVMAFFAVRFFTRRHLR